MIHIIYDTYFIYYMINIIIFINLIYMTSNLIRIFLKIEKYE